MKQIALILLFLSALAVFVRADDHDHDHDHEGEDDHDDHDHDEMEERERNVEVSINGVEATIECETRKGKNKDMLSYSMKAGSHGLEIEIEYEKESGSGESETEYRIVFSRLVEFADTNSNGLYTPGTDMAYNTVMLGGAGVWRNFESSSFVDSKTGETVYTVTAATVDNSTKIMVHVAGSEVEASEHVTLLPENIKIDVELHNEWRQQTTTWVALMVSQKSTTEVNYPEGKTDRIVSSNTEGAKTVFTWEPTAENGTGMINVGASALQVLTTDAENKEGETSYNIWFTFQSDAPHIIWDPRVGVTKASLEFSSASSTLPFFGALLLLLLAF